MRFEQQELQSTGYLMLCEGTGMARSSVNEQMALCSAHAGFEAHQQ